MIAHFQNLAEVSQPRPTLFLNHRLPSLISLFNIHHLLTAHCLKTALASGVTRMFLSQPKPLGFIREERNHLSLFFIICLNKQCFQEETKGIHKTKQMNKDKFHLNWPSLCGKVLSLIVVALPRWRAWRGLWNNCDVLMVPTLLLLCLL